jgi:hypothetical protein
MAECWGGVGREENDKRQPSFRIADRLWQSISSEGLLESFIYEFLAHFHSHIYVRIPLEYQGLQLYEQQDCSTIIINPSFGPEFHARETIAILTRPNYIR